MKELVLKIKKSNWGMMTHGSWKFTEWNIYNDLTVDIEKSYLNSEQKKTTVQLTEEVYNEILKKIELAKDNNMVINALDGSAWEYIQFDKEEIVWNRKQGYIYGIEPLEELEAILNNLIKQ